ncbi:hypothetical protein MA16_Dca017133 [Dendrobium catenatum]|uniref:Uncharacterized protein n=1 Tax=Dendrobium catenatum TaxID=906689 RepID=A0A2I0WAY4_9ASPA|nr:hypothetical protein MA16_Dca017133 [Dendrobium catenatum]
MQHNFDSHMKALRKAPATNGEILVENTAACWHSSQVEALACNSAPRLSFGPNQFLLVSVLPSYSPSGVFHALAGPSIYIDQGRTLIINGMDYQGI